MTEEFLTRFGEYLYNETVESDHPLSMNNKELHKFLRIFPELDPKDPKMRRFLLDYIESMDLDYSIIERRNPDSILSMATVQDLIDRLDNDQLYTFIFNKTMINGMIYYDDYHNIEEIVKSFYPEAQNIRKSEMILFDLPVGTQLTLYREKVKDLNPNSNKLKTFYNSTDTELITRRELYTEGYYYFYKTTEPLLDCVFLSSIVSFKLICNVPVLQGLLVENNKFLDNYLLETAKVAGLFGTQKVTLPRESLKKLKFYDVAQVKKFSPTETEQESMMINALKNKNYDLFNRLVLDFPLTKQIVNLINLDPKARHLFKDKVLIENLHIQAPGPTMIERIKYNSENESYLLDLEDKNWDLRIPKKIHARNTPKTFFLVASQEIDSLKMLSGVLKYRVFGEIYFIETLYLQMMALNIDRRLVEELIAEASRKGAKKIVAYPYGIMRYIYGDLGFKMLPTNIMCLEL